MARLEKILGADLGSAVEAALSALLLLRWLLSGSMVLSMLLLCLVFDPFSSAVLLLPSLLLLLPLTAVLSLSVAAASVQVMKRAISTSRSLRSFEVSRPLFCSSWPAILSRLQSSQTVRRPLDREY
jgi:hypothetical protein